ncbi:MAG: sodium:solute symporter family transporter, partial [Candidatus Aminicenantales bacterium]
MGVLKPLDWIIILVYFTIILGLAWKVMREKQRTSTDYFLAGRNLGWLIIGASIFASNIGAEH